MSPTSCASSSARAANSRPCGCAMHASMNWPPIRCRCWNTTLSFWNPERSPPMSLAEKLDRLTLSTMSRQLDQILSDAAARNLSVAATLEWLADMELEARRNRAIDRRFQLRFPIAGPAHAGTPLVGHHQFRGAL